MSAANRTQLINKLHKVAKKLHPPVAPVSSRSVLDHMLYACCLENSLADAADEAFAKLEQQYFDWNEVRVTTTKELAESMKGLYHPESAALSVKKALHGVFETYYKFDLEFLKKENLRKTVQQFSKFRGVSPFVVSYTAQVALGGHFIPLDDAMLQLMVVLGIVSENEAAKSKVPGLERTIAKSKGIEFSSSVHHLAAAFYKVPFGKDIRKTLLTIAPDATERFPKRGGKKKAAVVEEPSKPKTTKNAATARASGTPSKKKVAKKKVAKKPTKKKPVKAKAAKKKVAKKKAPKKAATRKKTARVARKTTKKKSIVEKASRGRKKSATRSLSRKKPR